MMMTAITTNYLIIEKFFFMVVCAHPRSVCTRTVRRMFLCNLLIPRLSHSTSLVVVERIFNPKIIRLKYTNFFRDVRTGKKLPYYPFSNGQTMVLLACAFLSSIHHFCLDLSYAIMVPYGSLPCR